MKRIIPLLLVFILGASTLFSQNASPRNLRFLESQVSEKSANIENADINYIPKRPGLYTVEDWAEVIDSVWGPGLPTSEKLKIFDNVWSTINTNFAAFHELDLDWDAIRDHYRPIVANTTNPISRGRFAAIMNQLGNSLNESLTYIEDTLVCSSNQLKNYGHGYPLFLVGPNAMVNHFGAGLTPLPDSSLLVIKSLPNHPLNLKPGDVVLGYDGIPWNILYKDLLAYELPIRFLYIGSSEYARTHAFLKSAGMNWHLYDTLDVVKYATGDTLHFNTKLLEGQTNEIWGNEQLPIAGIDWPDVLEDDLVSWGYIEGTQIGYIYVVGSWSNDLGPEKTVENDFYKAIYGLIYNKDTKGIIIDVRTTYGGSYQQFNKGLSLLFNINVETIGFSKRCGSDHFRMCDGGNWTLCSSNSIIGQAEQMYKKPIALLMGPGTLWTGEGLVYKLSKHPQVNTFGKPSPGTIGSESTSNVLGKPEWLLNYALFNAYKCGEEGHYLTGIGMDVDHDVWFTPESVAEGRDLVVDSAMSWIENYGTALGRIDKDKSHQVFPNPATHMLHIKGMVRPEMVYIYNFLGQKVIECRCKDLLDISELRNGVYLIRFENGVTLKFTKLE